MGTKERPRRRAIVVGAGALGGWTALHLTRLGWGVTLVDAWGPGNGRASSGGETRVIRRGYGHRGHYVPLVTRALELWSELEAATKTRLLDRRGVLWMAGRPGAFEEESMDVFRAEGVPFEELNRGELEERYPSMSFSDIPWAMFEPDAGALFARRGCEVVWGAVREAGGQVLVSTARPDLDASGACRGVLLADGTARLADVTVFAAGPWMPELFPDTLRQRLYVTRQDVFSFGPPPGAGDHMRLPVWAEHAAELFGDGSFWYGIPGGLSRGFKLGEDTSGGPWDPTHGERVVDPLRLERARAYLSHRFPALADAPLIDARVCQYTMRQDSELLVDRHPELPGLWLMGGGSGHGYKLGPAIGEVAARAIDRDEALPEPLRGLQLLG
ncbi:MAG: FAD-dependent oxidoreductase [Planctomycetota bacterium]